MGESTGLIRLAIVVVAAMVAIGGFAWGAGLGQEGRGLDRHRERKSEQSFTSPVAAAPEMVDGAGGTCTVEGAPMPLPEALHEASGLALGRGGRLLWTHSDTGEPHLGAVSLDGQMLGTIRVAGAAVEDWEDVASGPCEAGRCLFIGDIGDNEAARSRITVYRVAEPAPGDGESAPAAALHATYPDGSHDAEALFVDPAGRIHIVTKGETGAVALYRFPALPAPGSVSRLEKVRSITAGTVDRPQRITGASASADGRWIALRSLRAVALYSPAALMGGAAEPIRFDLSAAEEAQGEGIALAAGGVAYLASEGGKRRDPAMLTRVVCPLPD